MKGLFLPGYGCTPWIWDNIKDHINEGNDLEFIEWPRSKTINFINLIDFTNWVKENYIVNEYDFIVGHSMGGLVALQLSTLKDVNIKQVILVESFITSPTKFFQNLVMDNLDENLKDKIIDMLKSESKFYSPKLGNQLKELDLTNLINISNSKIHLIYGDRGYNNPSTVIEELSLPKFKEKLLNINIVHNSCHFPMLENSEQFINLLKNII